MKGNLRLSKLLMVCLCVSTIFLMSACNSVEKIEHIEVYSTETTDSSGITGYMNVNSVILFVGGLVEYAKLIEDHYDIEGNYIVTVLIDSYFEKGIAKEDRKVILEPSVILIPEGIEAPFGLNDMTAEEKQKVKDHVLSLVDNL